MGRSASSIFRTTPRVGAKTLYARELAGSREECRAFAGHTGRGLPSNCVVAKMRPRAQLIAIEALPKLTSYFNDELSGPKVAWKSDSGDESIVAGSDEFDRHCWC